MIFPNRAFVGGRLRADPIRGENKKGAWTVLPLLNPQPGNFANILVTVMCNSRVTHYLETYEKPPLAQGDTILVDGHLGNYRGDSGQPELIVRAKIVYVLGRARGNQEHMLGDGEEWQDDDALGLPST